MSGYAYTHPMPVRDVCEACGHSLWSAPELPRFGPRTRAEQDYSDAMQRLSGLYRELYLAKARKLVEL